MVKCIQRYRTIKQITQHAKMTGKESSLQRCIPDLDEKKNAKGFKLATYRIEGTDGFMREGADGFPGSNAV